MGLDKVVIKHLDVMEALEERLDKEIDGLYKKLNIDELIENPEGALIDFSAQVKDLLEYRYFPEAAEEGIGFAQKVEKDGSIEVPKSKDPKLNEDLDDKSKNKDES